jgi:hypothetical protein
MISSSDIDGVTPICPRVKKCILPVGSSTSTVVFLFMTYYKPYTDILQIYLLRRYKLLFT